MSIWERLSICRVRGPNGLTVSLVGRWLKWGSAVTIMLALIVAVVVVLVFVVVVVSVVVVGFCRRRPPRCRRRCRPRRRRRRHRRRRRRRRRHRRRRRRRRRRPKLRRRRSPLLALLRAYPTPSRGFLGPLPSRLVGARRMPSGGQPPRKPSTFQKGPLLETFRAPLEPSCCGRPEALEGFLNNKGPNKMTAYTRVGTLCWPDTWPRGPPGVLRGPTAGQEQAWEAR